MKRFRKKSDREIRINKTGLAKEAVGTIEHGQDVYVLTYGQFSLIDVITTILEQIGPSEIIISTWTAAHTNIDIAEELLKSDMITKIRFLLDRSFQTRQPKYFSHIVKTFGTKVIRELRLHSKFIVFQNENWNVVVRTSMNLNENPRMENVEISENKEFANFFVNFTDEIFKEVKELDNADLPVLLEMEDTHQFPLLEADLLPQKDLKGASFTHEMHKRKLRKSKKSGQE